MDEFIRGDANDNLSPPRLGGVILNRAQTQVQIQKKLIRPLAEFRTGVSLHSHTYHSKENLGFFPHYIDFLQTPIITWMLHSGLKRFRDIKGKSLDFHRAYWTPPVTPEMVAASEAEQIERNLGLAALVSITDHDTIDGPLSLQEQNASAPVSISVEWTIPFAGNTFHLGVHHLPPDQSVDIMKALSDYTTSPGEEKLRELLAFLHGSPDTLIVLNHPLQNLLRAKGAEHLASLRQLLVQCGPWIHALEWNGMRSWTENRDVLRMSEEYNMPVVAGGDRHGCRPNTVVNLSPSENWADFAGAIRTDRRNTVLLLPAYEEPAPLRELATASDVLRRYPDYPYGQRRFTDRIFFNLDGYGWRPVSFYWDGGNGKPIWLDPAVGVVIALGSDHLRRVFGLFFSRTAQFDHAVLSLGDVGARDSLERRAEVSVEPE